VEAITETASRKEKRFSGRKRFWLREFESLLLHFVDFLLAACISHDGHESLWATRRRSFYWGKVSFFVLTV
jgi:hypothetical protein